MSYFKPLQRLRTASSVWNMRAFRITVKLIRNCFLLVPKFLVSRIQSVCSIEYSST